MTVPTCSMGEHPVESAIDHPRKPMIGKSALYDATCLLDLADSESRLLSVCESSKLQAELDHLAPWRWLDAERNWTLRAVEYEATRGACKNVFARLPWAHSHGSRTNA